MKRRSTHTSTTVKMLMVILQMFLLFQGVFVAYDEKKIYSYIYKRENFNGNSTNVSLISGSVCCI